MFHQKIQHGIEAILLGITIHWQPIFGILASIAAMLYYLSMTKINVVDRKFNGSWKKYLKSIFRL